MWPWLLPLLLTSSSSSSSSDEKEEEGDDEQDDDDEPEVPEVQHPKDFSSSHIVSPKFNMKKFFFVSLIIAVAVGLVVWQFRAQLGLGGASLSSDAPAAEQKQTGSVTFGGIDLKVLESRLEALENYKEEDLQWRIRATSALNLLLRAQPSQ